MQIVTLLLVYLVKKRLIQRVDACKIQFLVNANFVNFNFNDALIFLFFLRCSPDHFFDTTRQISKCGKKLEKYFILKYTIFIII